MSGEFNTLEKAVLEWYAQHYSDPALIAQVRAASLKQRTWTKVGFYVGLEVPRQLQPIDFDHIGTKGFPIEGPHIEAAGIEHGGGSLLWGDNGYITQIELYAFGSFFREAISNFVLA
jgi:hypothetical protein